MPSISVHRMGCLSFSILFTCTITILISIAEIILETQIQRAFRNIAIQLPGTELGEWHFISLSPEKLNEGPAVAIMVASGFALLAGVMGVGWVLGFWWKVDDLKTEKLCFISCSVSAFGAIVATTSTMYVFVTESKQVLPAAVDEWQHASFTREFYLCNAIPSIVTFAEDLYGFPACGFAKAARLELVVLSCILVVTVATSLAQICDLKALNAAERKINNAEKALQWQREYAESQRALWQRLGLGRHSSSTRFSNASTLAPRNSINKWKI